ncbi:hypothetical protein D9M69_734720 [compost metagenome]
MRLDRPKSLAHPQGDEVDRRENDQPQEDVGDIHSAYCAVGGQVELLHAQDGRRCGQQENHEKRAVSAPQGARNPGQGGGGTHDQGGPLQDLDHGGSSGWLVWWFS